MQSPLAGPPAAAGPEPAPLPGAAPVTPLADLVTGMQQDAPPPPGLVAEEAAFSIEPVDTAWAPAARADILGKIAQVQGLELISLDVECRSTMCRVLTVRPTADTPHMKELVEAGELGEPRWIITTRDPSGLVRSVAYLWREGRVLPGR